MATKEAVSHVLTPYGSQHIEFLEQFDESSTCLCWRRFFEASLAYWEGEFMSAEGREGTGRAGTVVVDTPRT